MLSCFFRLLLIVALLALLSHSLARDEWCSEDHDHGDDDDHDDDDDDHDGEEEIDAHAEDFLVELFHLYGTNETCVITEEGRRSHLY